MNASSVCVRPVGPEQWQQLADFFGPSGAYSGCWCAWWRRTSAEFDAGCRDGAGGNRAVLQELTTGGRVPGLLAYDGSVPVGWVSVSPRPEFGRVLRVLEGYRVPAGSRVPPARDLHGHAVHVPQGRLHRGAAAPPRHPRRRTPDPPLITTPSS